MIILKLITPLILKEIEGSKFTCYKVRNKFCILKLEQILITSYKVLSMHSIFNLLIDSAAEACIYILNNVPDFLLLLIILLFLLFYARDQSKPIRNHWKVYLTANIIHAQLQAKTSTFSTLLHRK